MGDFFGTIGDGLLKVILPSLGTVIAGMVALVLKRLLAKYALEVTEKQEERLKQIVVDKIHATEEAAHRAAKEGVEFTGPQKAAKTERDVIVAAEADPSIPNPTPEKVAAVVDTTLAEVRAGYLPNVGLPGLGRR